MSSRDVAPLLPPAGEIPRVGRPGTGAAGIPLSVTKISRVHGLQAVAGTRPPGASGIERNRLPQAQKIAFAIAGATAMTDASPPLADV